MNKKLPVGRPRVKDADRKRGAQITLYLDHALLARLDAACEGADKHRADYIRGALISILNISEN